MAMPTWDLAEEEAVVDLVREQKASCQMLNVPCFSAVRTVRERVQSLSIPERTEHAYGVVRHHERSVELTTYLFDKAHSLLNYNY